MTIPLIEAPYVPLGYHDAVLEFDGGDAWRLKSIVQAHEIYGIEEVQLIQTDTFPVQVFLKIDGLLGYVCGKLYLDQRRAGSTFEISIQQASLGPELSCTASVAEYSWLVPLDVYGLPAGEYQYVVNEFAAAVYDPRPDSPLPIGTTGSFTLDEDNRLGDADAFPNFIHPQVTQVQEAP